MIDFRYHLVSIIAIFLALAVGIVLGTTALNGPAAQDLRNRVRNLSSDKNDLRGQKDTLQQQLDADGRFISTVTPALVAGKLKGQRVAVLSAPGVRGGLRTDVIGALRTAGATVSPQLQLTSDWVDPAQDRSLDDLVTRLTAAGGDVPTGSGSERAAAELADGVLARSGSTAPSTRRVAGTVAAYQRAGFLNVDGAPGKPATLALLLVPEPVATPATATYTAKALLQLAVAADRRAAGTVVAGPVAAAGPGGAVAAVRADRGASGAVSTVDTADTPTGQVLAVLALAEQAAGRSGSYGAGPGADPVPPTVR